MTGFEDRQLTDADIVRLGVEAGTRVLAMDDSPTQAQIDEAKDELGMRAIELAYTQKSDPEGGVDYDA